MGGAGGDAVAIHQGFSAVDLLAGWPGAANTRRAAHLLTPRCKALLVDLVSPPCRIQISAPQA